MTAFPFPGVDDVPERTGGRHASPKRIMKFRETSSKPAHLVWFEDVRLDLRDERLWRGERVLPLSPKAFALLRYLVGQPGQLVTKAALFEAVWPDTAVGDAVLTVAIGELRRALGDDSRAPRFIETVHRRGYRFLPSIRSSPPSGVATEAIGSSSPPGPGRDVTPSAPEHTASLVVSGGLVGREREMGRLHACLDRALAGERQMVFVTGEAGIGKTALVEAFLDEVGRSTNAWIGQGQCIEHYGAGEVYLPLFAALHQLCRRPDGLQLREILGRYAPNWLAQMPSLLDAATVEAFSAGPQGPTRDRMLREMADALEAVTADHPIVLALEDLHWSDHASVELLSFLARRGPAARLLVIGTYRPADVLAREHPVAAVKDDLASRRLCRELPLERLTAVAVRGYVDTVLAGHRIPDALIARLHQRTGGNPLFVVNVIQDWITQGVLSRMGGHWELQGAVEDAARGVPASVRQLIEQHLARLDPADQRLLEAASVVGDEFSAALVADELAEDIEMVEDRCAALARRHLLVSRGTAEWPDGTIAGRYAFAHALYHEVLYEEVPVGRRVQLHRRIGRRLDTAFASRTEEIAAELSAHLERGREHALAVRSLEQAARKVLRRSAPAQAVRHLERALELLSALPDTTERARQELTVQTTLGHALTAVHGYMARDVGRAYSRARELCQRIGPSPGLAPVLFGLWGYHLVRAEHETARNIAGQLRHLADATRQDEGLQVAAHAALGVSLLCAGEAFDGYIELQRAIARYEPQTHRSLAASYGVDPCVAARAYAGLGLWLLGFVDQAARTSDQATAHARDLGHPVSLAFALNVAALVFLARREPAAAEQRVEALVALSSELALPYWGAQSAMQHGWALVQRGDHAGGAARVRTVLDAWRAEGRALLAPSYLGVIGEALGATGEPERGIDALDEALAEIERTGERWWEAEILRLKGALLLKSPSRTADAKRRRAAEAEGCFERALGVARHQRARSLELRAATSLARLRGADAATLLLLQEVHARFTEGHDTPDLQEARGLLPAGQPGAPLVRSAG
jgi:DNA-binding winged helix-turn-helix (wHTH) protein/predicted ATPase